MNLIPRQDRLLAAGLALALPIVVFARPIERWLLALAREAERGSGPALVPALFVLTLALVVHQQGKRFEAALAGTTSEGRRDVERAHAVGAERALANPILLEPIETEGHLCVPLTAGGHTVGVLGVPDTAGPFTDERRRILATVAAVLAIAVRNAQRCFRRSARTACATR